MRTRLFVWLNFVLLLSASLPHVHPAEHAADATPARATASESASPSDFDPEFEPAFELGNDSAHDEHSPTSGLVGAECRLCRTNGDELAIPRDTDGAPHDELNHLRAMRMALHPTSADPRYRPPARAPPSTRAA